MTSTISDVERYLGQARDLEDYWRDYGWETLNKDEIGEVEILDIYPIVEVDISVNITIKLVNKSYSVPLEDISSLPVNDCLVIEVKDLYSDWEQRVLDKIDQSELLRYKLSFSDDDICEWHTRKYIGEDKKIRVIKNTVY